MQRIGKPARPYNLSQHIPKTKPRLRKHAEQNGAVQIRHLAPRSPYSVWHWPGKKPEE